MQTKAKLFFFCALQRAKRAAHSQHLQRGIFLPPNHQTDKCRAQVIQRLLGHIDAGFFSLSDSDHSYVGGRPLSGLDCLVNPEKAKMCQDEGKKKRLN